MISEAAREAFRKRAETHKQAFEARLSSLGKDIRFTGGQPAAPRVDQKLIISVHRLGEGIPCDHLVTVNAGFPPPREVQGLIVTLRRADRDDIIHRATTDRRGQVRLKGLEAVEYRLQVNQADVDDAAVGGRPLVGERPKQHPLFDATSLYNQMRATAQPAEKGRSYLEWLRARAKRLEGQELQTGGVAEEARAELERVLNCRAIPSKEELLAEALEVARGIGDEHLCSLALAELAPRLEGEQRRAVLTEVRLMARGIRDPDSRRSVLGDLAPLLKGNRRQAVLTEAIQAATAIEDEDCRSRALATLAPHLEGELLAKALVVARFFRDDSERSCILQVLAARLEGEQRQAILAEALLAARSIGNEDSRSRAVAELAPCLEGVLLDEALAIVKNVRAEYYRSRGLLALLSHLPEEHRVLALDETVVTARKMSNPATRNEILALLASHMVNEQRWAVLAEAIEAVPDIVSEFSRSDAIVALARLLEDHHLPKVLEVARSIGDDEARGEALASLFPRLTREEQPTVLQETLQAAKGIHDVDRRIRVLTPLLPNLNKSTFAQALEDASAVRDRDLRGDILTGIAPRLEGELLVEALAVARKIRNKKDRSRALEALAARLEGEHRQTVLAEALRTAKRIGNQGVRSRAVAALVPLLDGTLLAEALQVARCIKNHVHRNHILEILAPRLEGEQRRAVLAEMLMASRIRFVRKVVRRIPESDVDEMHSFEDQLRHLPGVDLARLTDLWPVANSIQVAESASSVKVLDAIPFSILVARSVFSAAQLSGYLTLTQERDRTRTLGFAPKPSREVVCVHGGDTSSSMIYRQGPPPRRGRALLLDPEVIARLAAILKLPPPGEDKDVPPILQQAFQADTLATNAEVARILAAVPDWEGVPDPEVPGCIRFNRLPVPDNIGAFPPRPKGNPFLVLFFDSEEEAVTN